MTRKLPLTRRNALRTGLGATAASMFAARQAPAQVGTAKPFQGTTINVSCWSAPYPKWLADYIPEFTEKTGIKVNYDTPGFPVYNQRADLELSTKGSAFDVLNITFIYTSRWIGAGWFTPLDEFIKNPNKTPADWGLDDFPAGLMQPMSDKNGRVHGIPWIADAFMAGAGRMDLLKAAGVSMPDSLDELEAACKLVNNKDGTKAFLTENHYGWVWIPFLQSFGGNVFRNPPDDLMPTLDTPEAAAAAEYFVKLMKEYGPADALSYNYDQALAVLKQGRVNLSANNQAFLVQLADKNTSNVTATCGFGIFPKGPKGRFPGIATHGWGIPTGSKNKDAAWEFIKWSMSKDMTRRMVVEKGYGSITRKSVIASAEFKQKMTINGQDVGKIFVDTLDMAGQGHMKYRTVHVYPQVNTQITKAIENVLSGQMSAREALRLAQTNSLTDLRRAGVKL